MGLAALLAVLALGVPPQKLAAPGLTGLDVPPDALAFYNEHLSLGLTRRGLEVRTAKQIEAVVGLERQRELLGCSDASCMAEIASALGVDAMVIGEIGKFGEEYQVHIKVVSSADARLLASYSKRVAAAVMLDTLDEAAGALVSALGIRAEPEGPPLVLPIATGVAAAVAFALGAGLLAQSGSRWGQLHDASGSLSDSAALELARAGSREQTWGWVAVGVGSVALAATAVLTGLKLAAGRASASAVVAPGGGGLVVQVRWP